MESLVVEFQQQLANTPSAEVYDWGYSSRFRQGFIVVSWKGRVPLEFQRQLDRDDRLEGYSFSHPVEEPMYIAARKGA
jgi:hypothetical protein